MRTEKNIGLAEFTYYKIGGIAAEGYFPESAAETLEIVKQLRDAGTDYFLLGGGTNVLVGDKYWDGAVVFTSGMDSFSVYGESLSCGAGLPASRAAEIALENSMTGLEFLYLLPGSIGGALAGNARYDSRSMSDVFLRTVAVHSEKGLRTFENNEIEFEYKHTGIIGEGWIICEIQCSWTKGNYEQSKAYMKEIEISRNESHQFDFPSCGCIYKNDHSRNIQVGKLLDSLGMKGMRNGGAEVSPYHANFIINNGNATAREVLALMEKIESAVYEKTGIRLEREVRLLGNFG